jgi:hydroxypyruvate isomerase
MSHALPYAANCSMLFTEHPLLERPAAAKDAGFSAIEFWWPWPDQPVPADSVGGRLRRAHPGGCIPLIGLQLLRRRPGRPDAGVLSVPARSAEFPRQHRCGGRHRRGPGASSALNALYGNRIDGVPASSRTNWPPRT